MTPDLRFPIGPYTPARDQGEPPAVQRNVERISSVPTRLRAAVGGLREAQLDTPYRPGGWTVRQVVHHLPDSHLNSFVRLKLALTEDQPTIRTYHEDRWSELPDAFAPLEISLDLLETLHTRWVYLLRALEPAQLRRRLRHPDLGILSIADLVAFYAWHGDHHIAHITSLREREGW